MKDLAKEGMTMLIVTHEWALPKKLYLSDLFMDEGIVMEEGLLQELFEQSQNPRTCDFLSKVL